MSWFESCVMDMSAVGNADIKPPVANNIGNKPL